MYLSIYGQPDLIDEVILSFVVEKDLLGRKNLNFMSDDVEGDDTLEQCYHRL